MGKNEKAGFAYVGLSRSTNFEKIVIQDISKTNFKKYMTNGKRIKEQLKDIKKKEYDFLAKLNRMNIWFIIKFFY